MNNTNLFFSICNPMLNKKICVNYICNQEELFGQIVLNKMVGISINNIDLQSLNPELQKAIDLINNNYIYKSLVFQKHLNHLGNILANADFDYALLKGAFLSTNIYSLGQRISNDIDILVSPKNVSKLQTLLLSNGFIQGFIQKNSEIRSATRKEIIDAKMNTGETVPFVKIVEEEPLEIDINFSLDFKASDNSIVEGFLNDTIDATFEDVCFKTLSPIKFLLHLACHLYKEATTYDWVVRRRDLMLYKFCDIYMFICKYGTLEYFSGLTEQINKYGLEKECYYTFENASIIYPTLNDIDGFIRVKESIKPDKTDFMKQIVYPRDKKLFKYNMSFTDWFFCPDRISHLEEIPYEKY